MKISNNLLPLSAFLAATVVLTMMRASTHPSLNRPWEPNQAILASIDIKGNDIYIRNIRNTEYRSATDYVPTYFDRNLKMSDLRRACLVKEKLDGFGNAHVMITFQFANSDWLVISPEPRLERGEAFSALKGLFRRYEIAYFLSTETDALFLRTNVLNRPVTLYELRVDDDKVRALFTSMVERQSELARQPEFYHTLFNSVSGNVASHLRAIGNKKVVGPLMLPANTDRLAHEMNLLRRDVSFNILAGSGMITDEARSCAANGEYSEKIHMTVSQIQEGL